MIWLSGYRNLKGRTLVVHLLSGQSVQGVQTARYRDCIRLSEVVHLDAGEKLEGDLVVPLDRIDYYQTGGIRS